MFWHGNMTTFFNLNTLEAQAKGDYTKFILLFQKHCKGSLFQAKSLSGSSYILNPTPLFANKNLDILYKIQYIKLAAKRDYTLYKLYRIASLDLTFYPDIDINKVRINPLLNIENKQIYFLYEELKRKTKWH